MRWRRRAGQGAARTQALPAIAGKGSPGLIGRMRAMRLMGLMGRARCGLLGAALGLLLGLLQTGCASPPSNVLAPGHSGADAQRILVFPMNVFLTLPPEVGDGGTRVAQALAQYLEDQGKQVEHLGYRESRRAWLRAVRAAKQALEASPQLASLSPPPAGGAADEGEEKFEAALAQLAPMLAQEHAFDALLVPAVVQRKAVLTGRSVRWDGVSRGLEVGRMPATGDNILWSDPYFGRQEIGAPSLWVAVALPDGTKIFQGVGGLDLTVRAEFVNQVAQRHYQLRTAFVPVEEPFADPDALREGIALALAPYLPYRPQRPAPAE